MLTLFGSLDSGNVHKVQLILRRLQIRYERVDVAQARGEPRQPAFLALNPIGKVPVVRLEDGSVLCESGAILYYFARSTNLWPRNAGQQAQVLQWMFFEQYSHEPTLAVIRYLRHYAPGAERDAPRSAALAARAGEALGVMEGRLTEAEWLVGEHCTIADYALYPYTASMAESGFEVSAYPGIAAWLTRFAGEPGFIAMPGEGAERVLSFAEYFTPAGAT